MSSICANGACRMPHIVAHASADIAPQLWTLYWLGRLTCSGSKKDLAMVELGVREGDSTRALLAAAQDEDRVLYSVDVEDCRDRVESKTRAFGLSHEAGWWHFLKGDSLQIGKAWKKDPKLALVYIDTDHTYETTKEELKIWAPHVQEYGAMVLHDYWLSGAGVKSAADEWYEAHKKAWRLETHDAYGPATGLAILWRKGR